MRAIQDIRLAGLEYSVNHFRLGLVGLDGFRENLPTFSEEDGIFMKRSLRNGLCQIFLDGIREGGREDVFIYLRSLCRVYRRHGQFMLPLRVSRGLEEETVKRLLEVEIFDLSVDREVEFEGSLQLKPEWRSEMDQVCSRVDRYDSVFSQIRKQIQSGNGLEDGIRLGAVLFNQGLYFECHEYLEGIWKMEQGDRKEYLQGIICIATAFYHLEEGNAPSALKLLDQGSRRLVRFEKTIPFLVFHPLFQHIKIIKDKLTEQGLRKGQKYVFANPPTIHIL